mgnify:CR=1 FL=1|jgi:hypothetical protein
MTPNKIFPRPNLVIYLPHQVIVTVQSKEPGVVAIINFVNKIKDREYVDVLKFSWNEDEDLQTFVNRLRFNLTGDLTINTVLAYTRNEGEEFILYSRERDAVKLTKKEIAEKFGTSEEYLEIV